MKAIRVEIYKNGRRRVFRAPPGHTFQVSQFGVSENRGRYRGLSRYSCGADLVIGVARSGKRRVMAQRVTVTTAGARTITVPQSPSPLMVAVEAAVRRLR